MGAAGRRFILSSQKQSIFERIKATGLDPAQFEWREVPSNFDAGVVSQLSHTPSNYYFTFDFKNGVEYALFSPGENASTGGEYPGSWQLQYAAMQRWLGYLRRELHAHDPWEAALSAMRTTALLNVIAVPQAHIDEAAARLIQKELSAFRAETAASLQLTGEQLRLLDERLEYLVHAARRQTLQDWLFLAIGVFLQFLLSSPGIQEQAGALWVLLRAALTRVIVGGRTLPH